MLSPGQRLGRYEVVSPLGAGGMGEVYRALDAELQREVAIKVLPEELSSDPDRLKRFEREAKATAALAHPNVLTVFDVGRENGRAYLVSELLQGSTLAEAMKDAGLRAGEALDYAAQMARGLAAAHARGIVHRDVKPANLFVTASGVLKILDFGLARIGNVAAQAPEETTAEVTGPGVALGTVSYMSPEQVRGLAVDGRSDLFSLGVVLYEMLSGRHPFRKMSSAETVTAILRDEPIALEALEGRVPFAVGRLVERCLEKRPEDRFQTANDLALALDLLAGGEDAGPRHPGKGVSGRRAEERPYPGLAAFTEADAAQFFGREDEVQALWEKVRQQKLLAVIGPSGVGKTSFLRAGVLTSKPTGWAAVYATPGTSPAVSLARSLTPVLSGDTEAVADLLEGVRQLAEGAPADAMVSAVGRWRRKHAEALIVLDQFEELFTQNEPAVASRFAAFVGRLAEDAGVHVLLALRDDFLFRCGEHAGLRPAFRDLTPLCPPTEEALRRALVEPAARLGFRFEDPALLEEILEEVKGERGALPLVAFAVSRLWESRDPERKLLTRDAYRAIGGVAGALAQHAEATLERIGAAREPLVREVFRGLASAQGTRVVREPDELLSLFRKDGDPAARAEAEDVLNVLVDARLLTAYERTADGAARHQELEIVHESLLSAWPRLVRWRAQDADGAVLRDQLHQAAQLWLDRGRSADVLWAGQAYRDFALWRERYQAPLTANEEAFARAMHLQATRRRRLRRVAAAALLGVAATVAGVTSVLWTRAEGSRRRAEAETLRAEAGKLLALGERELERYPTAALAYVLKALELADTEGGRLLAVRVLQRGPVARFAPESESVTSAFSPSGEWVALGGWTRLQLLHRDGGPARLLGEYPAKSNQFVGVQFGPTGDVLASTYHNDPPRVWSMPAGKELRRLDLMADEAGASHLTGDGLITETKAGVLTLIRRWSFDGGAPRQIGSMEGFPNAHVFAGSWLAYAQGRKAYLRSLESWHLPPRLLFEHAAEIKRVQLSPDGNRAAISAEGALRIGATSATPFRPERVLRVEWGDFDPSGRWLVSHGTVAGHPRWRLFDLGAPPGAEPVVLTRADTDFDGQLAFDPAGQWLVTASNKDGTAVWWLGGARPSVLIVSEDAERERIRDLAFTPDGRFVMSVSMTGTVRAWPLSARDEPRVLLGAVDWYHPVMALHPAGRQVAAGLSRGRVFLAGIEGGPPRELQGFSARTSIGAVAFGDGGRLLAAAPRTGPRDEKVVRIFDLETGAARSFGPLPGVGEGAAGGIQGLAFVDRDRLLASVTGAGLVSVDLATGEIRALAKQPSGSFRLSLEGRLGLGVNESGTGAASDPLVRFSLDGTAPTPLTSYPSATAVAVDASGTRVATGSADGTIRIGPVAGGEPHVFFGHESSVVALAFSPDGRWLASTVNDRTIWLWPVPDVTKPPPHKRPYQQLLAALRTHTNLRAVPDRASATGYMLEPGPFPGWAHPPAW